MADGFPGSEPIVFGMSALLPEGTKPAAPIPVTPQDLHVVVVDFGLAQMSSSSEPRFSVPALVGIGEHQETQEIGRLMTVKHCKHHQKNQPFLGLWVHSSHQNTFGYTVEQIQGLWALEMKHPIFWDPNFESFRYPFMSHHKSQNGLKGRNTGTSLFWGNNNMCPADFPQVFPLNP